MDLDLSNSVIVPHDHYVELESAAYNQDPKTFKQQVNTAVATSLFVALSGAAAVGATWGWARAVDWLETRRAVRRRLDREHQNWAKPEQ